MHAARPPQEYATMSMNCPFPRPPFRMLCASTAGVSRRVPTEHAAAAAGVRDGAPRQWRLASRRRPCVRVRVVRHAARRHARERGRAVPRAAGVALLDGPVAGVGVLQHLPARLSACRQTGRRGCTSSCRLTTRRWECVGWGATWGWAVGVGVWVCGCGSGRRGTVRSCRVGEATWQGGERAGLFGAQFGVRHQAG
eukprot:363083-Chlamydomonas_euryale.AAC.10